MKQIQCTIELNQPKICNYVICQNIHFSFIIFQLLIEDFHFLGIFLHRSTERWYEGQRSLLPSDSRHNILVPKGLLWARNRRGRMDSEFDTDKNSINPYLMLFFNLYLFLFFSRALSLSLSLSIPSFYFSFDAKLPQPHIFKETSLQHCVVRSTAMGLTNLQL